jgi:multiple sugar transport system permease protein
METKNNWKAWLYLAPALVILAIFTFYPILNTIRLSFLEGYKSTLAANGKTFEFGFGNYVQVFNKASGLMEAFTNTAVLAIITVPLSTILALLIAVGLNSIKFLQKFLQTIFFLPYVTNAIAIGMVFAMIFNVVGTGNYVEDMGLFNRLLTAFGIDMKEWISVGAPKANKYFVMCVYIIWNALPFKIMILLGALQSVNKQYYEAAKVDGTSKFRVFLKITVPLISPMLVYVLITGMIGAFKEYSSVVGIFGEKPATYGMDTMVGLIYTSMDQLFDGRAAAGAVLLFIVILIITGIQFLVTKKKVHY